MPPLEADGPVAAAILVATEGSAPLAIGSVMLVDETGAIEGSLTGGCVESSVAQEAMKLLGHGKSAPLLLTYGISDELAGTVGLMCGGTVHIFVVVLDTQCAGHLRHFYAASAENRPAGIAVLLDGERAGSILLLEEDQQGEAGAHEGSLESGELLDHNVVGDLRGLLSSGRSEILRYGRDGSRLGSSRRVFMHTRASAPQMLLVGAVDFSAALAPMARAVGYRVTICDPRPAFANSPRFSRSAEIIVGWPDALFAGRIVNPADVVLVFSHDPRLDVPALLDAVETEAGYIGALGSRKTTEDRIRRLKEAEATAAQLERITSPAGLDIGSASPEETAISILAEIIAKKSGRPGTPLRESDSASIRPRPATGVEAI